VDALVHLCESAETPKKPDRHRASTNVRLQLHRQMQLLHAQERTHLEIAGITGYMRTYVSSLLKRLASEPAMLEGFDDRTKLLKDLGRGSINSYPDECDKTSTQAMSIQARGVPLNVALFFEPAYPLETRRGGQIKLSGQLRYGFASIGLQTLQN
jgi:hypothetical protein